MRAGVIEVFALEIDLRAAEMLRQALGEIERIGTPDIVLEQAVELGMKRGVVLHLVVGPLQTQQQRHQRLGDEAAAEIAEMAARVGAEREAVRPGVGHAAPAMFVYGALRAAATKAAIFSGLLRPGASSTPEDASTKLRARDLDGARDVLGVEAARKTEGPLEGAAGDKLPVERSAPAARTRGGGVRLGVEQKIVGRVLIGMGADDVLGVGDGKHLDDGPGGAGRDRGSARGRFVAVELDQIGRDRRHHLVHHGVGRIDKKCHDAGATAQQSCEDGGLIERQMARTAFEEHETGEVGTGTKRGVGRVPAVDPADFDHHAHEGLIAADQG